MPECQQELMEIVDVAIKEFNSKEKYLIKNDLSERCICAKFATASFQTFGMGQRTRLYMQSMLN